MTDLVYFGYDYEEDSYANQVEFMKDIKEAFPNVVFNDAYDSIKGYRKEVILDSNQNDDYYAWIIANGWYDASLSMSLILMSKENKEEAERLIELAKKAYPQNFKN